MIDEDLATLVKDAMNVRLALAPAAEAMTWCAPRRRHLGVVESACLDIVIGWTLARGQKWRPLGSIAFRQFVEGIGLSWGQGSARTVSRALDNLVAKGVLGRHRPGARRPTWYWLRLIEEVLERQHQHHRDDVGREDADYALDRLQSLADSVSTDEPTEALLAVSRQQTPAPNGHASVSTNPGALLALAPRSVSTDPPSLLAPGKQRLTKTLYKDSQEGLSSVPLDVRPLQQEKDETGYCGKHDRSRTCIYCRQATRVNSRG